MTRRFLLFDLVRESYDTAGLVGKQFGLAERIQFTERGLLARQDVINNALASDILNLSA